MKKKPKHVPVTPVKKPGDMRLTARANVLLLASLFMFIGGLVASHAIKSDLRWYAAAAGVVGLLFSCCISFGDGTLRYIREARGHLHESGNFPDWFLKRASRWYCYRAGVLALARQEGRASDLPRKFQNWMTPTLL